MLKVIVRFVVIISIVFTLYNCSSPTEVDVFNEFENSFSPIIIGMEKQYFYYSDSTYQNSKISGRATREDGQEVIIVESNSTSYPRPIHSTYRFIRDGYLYVTSLIKKNDELNPFGEIKIAKIFPQEGDSWYLNSSDSDSVKVLFKVKYIGEMVTPAGTFKDVISVQYKDTHQSSPDLENVYYSKGIGHIGSLSNGSLVLVNYVKIGDKEYGEQIAQSLFK